MFVSMSYDTEGGYSLIPFGAVGEDVHHIGVADVVVVVLGGSRRGAQPPPEAAVVANGVNGLSKLAARWRGRTCPLLRGW